MKVFLSYRRDDTGGRAGRLFDVFTDRYGARNVFQDVNATPPGLDFETRVDHAIADSDVVLVVIGRAWFGGSAPDGRRRIDQADDFVRREVSAALGTGIPVVPVLVDDAELPTLDQLPEELRGLLRRQAVSVRDVSWHQDVEDLIRRLEGEPIPFDHRRRRRRLLVAASVAAIVAIVIVAVIVATRDSSESGSASEEPPGCPAADDTWTIVTPTADPPTALLHDAHPIEIQVVKAWTRSGATGAQVLIRVAYSNRRERAPGTSDNDVPYLSTSVFDDLLVDGVAQKALTCFSVEGDPSVDAGERAIATLGYNSTVDPRNAPMILEVYSDFTVPVAAGE